jgi:hypothetical protein
MKPEEKMLELKRWLQEQILVSGSAEGLEGYTPNPDVDRVPSELGKVAAYRNVLTRLAQLDEDTKN